MSSFTLTNAKIHNGHWTALLSKGTGVPRIEVLHLDRPLDDVAVTEIDEGWQVSVAIPAEAISEGVQTFLVMDKTAGERLADFTLIAGEALGDDIRAETALLRAELDMLKRAFRRHCVETA